MSEAAPDAVEYVPAAHATHADWLVAASELEYVPGSHARQTEADLAPTSDDHVPALQLFLTKFQPHAKLDFAGTKHVATGKFHRNNL